MNPVAAKATFWETLNFSAGREKSLSPAATSPHLASGAQKKIVLVLATPDRLPVEEQERTWAQLGGS
jgi:hypothetical protein